MNEINRTMQDMKEEFNNSIELLKFWDEKLIKSNLS
jgi:hypothetical protein